MPSMKETTPAAKRLTLHELKEAAEELLKVRNLLEACKYFEGATLSVECRNPRVLAEILYLKLGRGEVIKLLLESQEHYAMFLRAYNIDPGEDVCPSL